MWFCLSHPLACLFWRDIQHQMRAEGRGYVCCTKRSIKMELINGIDFGCIPFSTWLDLMQLFALFESHKNLFNNKMQFSILKMSKNSHPDGWNELEWKIVFASIEHWKLFCWLMLFNFWHCVYPEWVCVVDFVSRLSFYLSHMRWWVREFEAKNWKNKDVKENCYKIYEKCLRRKVGEIKTISKKFQHTLNVKCARENDLRAAKTLSNPPHPLALTSFFFRSLYII